MSRSRPVELGCLLGALALALPAESVARAQLDGGPAAADSAVVLRRARKAQRAFETTRRSHLPRTGEESGAATCDSRIGRFCYWYMPPSGDPPVEPPVISEARAVLLGELREAAGRLPGDDWIAGQQVRYLVEQHRPDLALATARRCRGTPWWCAALAGYAFHAAADYAPADSAYAEALAGMPADERCQWSDLSDLLDEDAGRYRKLACAERAEADARIWWLSDPLLVLAGNDLRTEHYARLTVSRTLEDSDNPHAIGWGADLRALILRYGSPESWTRPFSRPLSVEEPSVLGQEPGPSFWFFAVPPLPPPFGEEARPVAWDLARERPPARYAPRYAAAVGAIDRVQLARFRRGAGAVTVAAYDLRGDTLADGPGLRIALAVSRDPATPPVVSRDAEAAAGVLSIEAPWMPALVSLEALRPEQRRAARARILASDAETPSGVALSDLLLVRATPDSIADSLPAVAPRALLAPEIVAGSRVGLYWEIYGAPPSEPLRVEVRVEQGRDRRHAGALLGTHQCAGRGRAPMRVDWEEKPRGAPRPPGRSLVLDLSRLARGRYELFVAVSAGGGPAACAGRALEITGR